MAVFTFLDLAQRVLEEEKRPLSLEEIWQIAQNKGHAKLLRGTGKTPLATLGGRLYADMRDNRESVFVKAGARPRRFFLRGLLGGNDLESLVKSTESKTQVTYNPSFLERDLHPFLVYHARYALKALCKTINHSKGSKKEFGEWVHPDIVGCYFPLGEWKPELLDFGSTIGSIPVKLFSFELKRTLDFGNLRESFFQTVSNSSWANEGYLVAAVISREDEFLTEMQRLCSSFGIGLIALNLQDPDAAEVLYPAKYREYLDWDTMDKLTMNSDFKEFLVRIKKDIAGKEFRTEWYDRVFESEPLLKTIQK